MQHRDGACGLDRRRFDVYHASNQIEENDAPDCISAERPDRVLDAGKRQIGQSAPLGAGLVRRVRLQRTSGSGKWDYDVGGHGWGNQELQYYTRARIENARVGGGVLIIEARHEPYEGREYTSARLVTRGKASWTYGRFEIRARLPSGRGTWPAIWMLPDRQTYGSATGPTMARSTSWSTSASIPSGAWDRPHEGL